MGNPERIKMGIVKNRKEGYLDNLTNQIIRDLGITEDSHYGEDPRKNPPEFARAIYTVVLGWVKKKITNPVTFSQIITSFRAEEYELAIIPLSIADVVVNKKVFDGDGYDILQRLATFVLCIKICQKICEEITDSEDIIQAMSELEDNCSIFPHE